MRTVRVEVEDGLAVDAAAFAATVMATLNDPRGWGADGSLSFARTDGDAELRVVLASPTTVDDLCAPLRHRRARCSCGRNGHAVLNLRRWVAGDGRVRAGQGRRTGSTWSTTRSATCSGTGTSGAPAPGQLAPLMQQQSYKAAPCIPNAWPFP